MGPILKTTSLSLTLMIILAGTIVQQNHFPQIEQSEEKSTIVHTPYFKYVNPKLTDSIAKTLQKIFKSEIQYSTVEQRKFIYAKVDLNDDGHEEILVGLWGPYFCGSGGCTALLLSSNAMVMTKFTTIDYPFFISKEKTTGWKNIIIKSGGSYKTLRWKAGKYPSNPSMLPKTMITGIHKQTGLLSWTDFENTPYRF